MPEKFYCLRRTKGRVGRGDGSADAEVGVRILRNVIVTRTQDLVTKVQLKLFGQ